MTPEERAVVSNLGVIAKQVRNAMRYGDTKKVQAFLASERFLTSMAALPAPDRLRALGIVSEVLGAPASIRRKPRFPPPRRPIKWTELNKARFRKAWLQGGPEAGALAVGISYPAARIAGKRLGLLVATATATLARAA